MLNALNLLFLGGLMVSDIVLYSDTDYKVSSNREAVFQVSMHREWWREDGNGKCKYTGHAMPIVRDWEIVDNRGEGNEYRNPPNLMDTYGLAIVINKKICEGKAEERVFRTILKERLVEGGTLYEKATTHAQDFHSTSPDYRAKWVPQFLERLERNGASDPHSKIAFDDITASMTAVYEEQKAQLAAQGKSAEPAPAPKEPQ